MSSVEDFHCQTCGCRSFARVDERKEDGSFGPGPLVRCVECKVVTRLPPLSTASTEAGEPVAYMWRWLYTEGRVGAWRTCLQARESRPMTDVNAGMEVIPLFALPPPEQAMAERVGRLEAALKPFANPWCFSNCADDDEVTCKAGNGVLTVRVEHFRAADAALKAPSVTG